MSLPKCNYNLGGRNYYVKSPDYVIPKLLIILNALISGIITLVLSISLLYTIKRWNITVISSSSSIITSCILIIINGILVYDKFNPCTV